MGSTEQKKQRFMKGTEGGYDYLMVLEDDGQKMGVGVKPIMTFVQTNTQIGIRVRVAGTNDTGVINPFGGNNAKKDFPEVKFTQVGKERASIVFGAVVGTVTGMTIEDVEEILEKVELVDQLVELVEKSFQCDTYEPAISIDDLKQYLRDTYRKKLAEVIPSKTKTTGKKTDAPSPDGEEPAPPKPKNNVVPFTGKKKD